jgi:hypothetical protein
MHRQLNVTIAAMSSAESELSRLKQQLSPDDPRLELVNDAEIGTAWIIKRLRALTLPTAGTETDRGLVVEIPVRIDWEGEKDPLPVLCES